MLEPPAISEACLKASLQVEYDFAGIALTFLPLGADLSSAVYRATTSGRSSYFVKLRFGPFDELAALLPAWLAEHGVREIVAPLATLAGPPFARKPDYTVLVYPFVEGRDAYEGVLTDAQWAAFGRAMRQVHDAALPQELLRRLAVERFDPKWRIALRRAMEGLDGRDGGDTTGRRFAAFMRERRAEVLRMVERADRLAAALQAADLPAVLCHTDLHPGNLLVQPDGRFYIVDWDAPLLAPRERDLMYPGGAQGFPGRSPEEEEGLFFAGYGPVAVDPRAIAYYRLERVIEDLAIFCEQLLGAPDDGAGSEADREQAFRWAASNFLPGHTIEIAERSATRSGL